MRTETETAHAVAQMVCEHFGVTFAQLISKCRKEYFMRPRRIIYAILRNEMRLNLSEIGAMFKRDHTTVMFALEHISHRMWAYNEVRIKYETLRDKALAQFPEISHYGALNTPTLKAFHPIIISDLAPISCIWTHLKGVSV